MIETNINRTQIHMTRSPNDALGSGVGNTTGARVGDGVGI